MAVAAHWFRPPLAYCTTFHTLQLQMRMSYHTGILDVLERAPTHLQKYDMCQAEYFI